MRLALTALLVVVLAGMAVVLSSKFFTSSNPVSLFSAIVAERDVALESGLAYGENPRQKLDVYRPESGPAKAVVLFMYGGGWTKGRRSTYGFAGAALASRGFVTVIPDYRLYPEAGFPVFVRDAAAAYAYTIRKIAGGLPVFVMGHSAGAHIAALLAFDERYIQAAGEDLARPAGLVGLAGPYAFDPTTWPSTRRIFSNVKDADQARPIAFVSKDDPPALLMHGLGDTVVRMWNMHDLAEAMGKAGVPVRQVELAGLGHIGLVLSLARPFRWRGDVLEDAVAFLQKQIAARRSAR